jgi:hypothetical protein
MACLARHTTRTGIGRASVGSFKTSFYILPQAPPDGDSGIRGGPGKPSMTSWGFSGLSNLEQQPKPGETGSRPLEPPKHGMHAHTGGWHTKN